MSATTPAQIAHKTWRTLEPFHGMIYFTRTATEEYAALGIRGRAGYFASRSAPMGAVPAEVVIATFYNFHPDLVRAAVPSVWAHASPAEVSAARLRAVDRTLREILTAEDIVGADMVEAAALAERAARAGSVHGRALFAGHVSLDWPEEPHLRLWHAITLLREHRGDGHVAALLTEDLDPCEALISHGMVADGLASMDVLRTSRAWPDDEWEAATQRLVDRGLVALGPDGGGGFTPAGQEQRDRIETLTDQLSVEAWSALERGRGGSPARHRSPVEQGAAGGGVRTAP